MSILQLFSAVSLYLQAYIYLLSYHGMALIKLCDIMTKVANSHVRHDVINIIMNSSSLFMYEFFSVSWVCHQDTCTIFSFEILDCDIQHYSQDLTYSFGHMHLHTFATRKHAQYIPFEK